ALAGSAFVVDGTVNIAYTGAHMTEAGRIIPNQLRAVLNEHFRVRREPIPIEKGPPEGFTDNFGHPKIWEEDGVFYMLDGAQTRSDYGRAVVYSAGIRAASSTGANSAQTLISSVSCGHIPTSSQLRARMYLHFARMEWTNTATAIGMPV